MCLVSLFFLCYPSLECRRFTDKAYKPWFHPAALICFLISAEVSNRSAALVDRILSLIFLNLNIPLGLIKRLFSKLYIFYIFLFFPLPICVGWLQKHDCVSAAPDSVWSMNWWIKKRTWSVLCHSRSSSDCSHDDSSRPPFGEVQQFRTSKLMALLYISLHNQVLISFPLNWI